MSATADSSAWWQDFKAEKVSTGPQKLLKLLLQHFLFFYSHFSSLRGVGAAQRHIIARVSLRSYIFGNVKYCKHFVFLCWNSKHLKAVISTLQIIKKVLIRLESYKKRSSVRFQWWRLVFPVSAHKILLYICTVICPALRLLLFTTVVLFCVVLYHCTHSVTNPAGDRACLNTQGKTRRNDGRQHSSRQTYTHAYVWLTSFELKYPTVIVVLLRACGLVCDNTCFSLFNQTSQIAQIEGALSHYPLYCIKLTVETSSQTQWKF